MLWNIGLLASRLRDLRLRVFEIEVLESRIRLQVYGRIHTSLGFRV